MATAASARRRSCAASANTASARQQGNSGGAGQQREPGDDARLGQPPALGEQERADGEQQEQRLAVDGAEEHRGRGQREEEDGVPRRPRVAEPDARQPVAGATNAAAPAASETITPASRS